MAQFQHIYIEISNVCNLKCSFCPEVERRDQKMTAEDFSSVLDKVAGHTDAIYLHLMGEPFNHPEILEILDLCNRREIPTKLTTNGLLLTGKRREAALNSSIKQINFSLHSFTDNFVGKDPQDYIQRLVNFAFEAEQRRPDLYLNFRLWDHDAEQTGLTQNHSLRSRLEEAFGISIDLAKPDIRRRKNLLVRGRTYIHFDSRFEWPALDAPFYGKTGRCHGLKSHIGIHADGTVVPCCLDKEAKLSLGNIFDSDLSEITQSPRATAIRSGFDQNKLVEDLCQRCQFVTRFNRKSNTKGADLPR
jgi:radical SAM protein with 4Fe4S-binding SPASM domain